MTGPAGETFLTLFWTQKKERPHDDKKNESEKRDEYHISIIGVGSSCHKSKKHSSSLPT